MTKLPLASVGWRAPILSACGGGLYAQTFPARVRAIGLDAPVASALHSVEQDGSGCVDGTVRDYLVNLTLPAEGSVCPAPATAPSPVD
jgi:hypothetical protein